MAQSRSTYSLSKAEVKQIERGHQTDGSPLRARLRARPETPQD